jgi:hypothetical protein
MNETNILQLFLHSVLWWYRAPALYSFEIVEKVELYISIGFHINCIVKIITYALTVRVNMDSNAGIADYVNAIVFGSLYFIYCMYQLVVFTYTGFKEGMLILIAQVIKYMMLL